MASSNGDDSLKAAFDPEAFRHRAHQTVDVLADYLSRALDGHGPVLPPIAPKDALARFQVDYDHAEPASLDTLLADVLAASNHLHHPRYVGHQVAATLPTAALAELVSGLLNNGMAVYEMGPAATALERHLLGWLGGKLGFRAADGVFTSGGSLGNLTALLAARHRATGGGEFPLTKLVLFVGADAHYSNRRAARVLGLPADAVVPVAVDARRKMRIDALRAAIADAKRAGKRALAIVASACSTSTGSHDPLDAIADVAEEHGMWLHVDGAHGASAALSPKYRSLLAGIERADSVVWDMHKMMMVPALVTAVLFRDGEHSFDAFHEEASYLFGNPRDEWFNVGHRTLECTKRMMSFTVHAALRTHGVETFRTFVERQYDLARELARRVREAPDFELAVEPEANIVCFRHVPEGVSDVDPLQPRIRGAMLERAEFYLVQTRIDGRWYLRTTLMNPRTGPADLDALLRDIRAVSASLLGPC